MSKNFHQQPASTALLNSISDDEEYNETDAYRAGHRVNLDLDPSDKSLTPEEIATLFIEIAQRAEKCFNFEISAWLDKYEQLRQHPNFAEAALLISSASQIYARKVDYFEDMVLQMGGVKDGKLNKKGENDVDDQTKMIRRRGKKFRPNTIADSFSEADFIVKEFTQLPSAKLTEIIQQKKTDFNSHWEKFKASQCRFLKNKKNKLVVSKKMTENSELIATNATFGKTHIYDYDGEEVVGTKSDFRCFSNIINQNCELISDYNFTKYFEHVDFVDQEEEKRQQMIAVGLPTRSRQEVVGPKRFHLYISKEYLKETYDINVETTESDLNQSVATATNEKSLALEQNIGEFTDLKEKKADDDFNESGELVNTSHDSSKSIVSFDSAYHSIAEGDMSSQRLDVIPEDANETNEQNNEFINSQRTDTDDAHMSDETFFDAVQNQDMDVDHELTAINLNKVNDQGQTASGRLSIDEGISVRSPSIQSPNHLSETTSELNLDMTTQPNISDIFIEIHESFHTLSNNISQHLQSISEQEELEYLENLDKSNMFNIDPVYLNHKEEFELPFHYLLKPALLETNILQLPESKVRRRCLFTLPPDEFTLKSFYTKLPPEPKVPRIFKLQLFKIADVLDQNSTVPSPVTDDSEDEFLGFSNDELLNEFMTDSQFFIHSTPIKPNGNQENGNKEINDISLFEMPNDNGKRKADEPLIDNNAKRSSLDGVEALITDDEDEPESKTTSATTINTNTKSDDAKADSEENLTTPERIKRDAAARVSRDSGINAASPEPPETENDEVLTVTIDPNGIASQITQKCQASDSGSVDSFDTAENGPTLFNDSADQLSLHDKRLVEQAQQKYQQQVTEMQTLVEKVNRWHQYLKPILKDSQERSHFDIHECGTEILNIFNEETGPSEITFADIMNTKPDNQIARYFLSTLMLVNTGNVQIVTTNHNIDQITEPQEIQLKLKSRIRLHEEIENMNETVPCISKSKGTKRKAVDSGSIKSPKSQKKSKEIF